MSGVSSVYQVSVSSGLPVVKRGWQVFIIISGASQGVKSSFKGSTGN